MTKYHIEKNTVQETLIIPLYGRKVCSEKFPLLFKDPEAERICDGLDYDFSEKGKRMESGAGLFGALEVAQRQYNIACEVREYLNAHPHSGYLTEILPLKHFPDYIEYLPVGAIVRKIGVMGYLPKVTHKESDLIAISRTEYEKFCKDAIQIVVEKFRPEIREHNSEGK